MSPGMGLSHFLEMIMLERRICARPECGGEFLPIRESHRACSHSCAAKLRTGNLSADELKARRRATYHAHGAKRRAAQTEIGSDLTPEFIAGLRRKTKRCPMPDCGVTLIAEPYQPSSRELDHIVPLNQGGTHTVGNVRFICRACNASRPKDGRDFVGQPTLWSQASEILPGKSQKTPTPYGCGHARISGPLRKICPPCAGQRQRADAELGQQAAAMRAQGLKWDAIATMLGISNVGWGYQLAVKYGTPSDRGRWPARYSHAA